MFNMPLPTKNIFVALVLFLCVNVCEAKKQTPSPKKTCTVMLHPAGDAKYPGRPIDDSFERTITFECAQKLKTVIEQLHPHIAVIITRHPGQTVAPLHNANFANRLPADFFIDIRFYQETQAKPSLFIYYFSYQPECTQKPSDFTFYTHDQAYLFNYKASQQWAQTVYATCAKKTYAHQYVSHKPVAFPCAPLIGITAPALMIEVGLKHKTDWHALIDLLVETIELVAAV